MPQEERTKFTRATIVGPGLLGASIGMALSEKRIVEEVWAFVRDKRKQLQCEKMQWCSQASTNLKESVEKSDLIILCTPVESIPNIISEISNWLMTGSLVTDVGSLKQNICNHGDRVFDGLKSFFIGSHPMAGSEKSGMHYAKSEILNHRKCIITPTEKSNSKKVESIKNLWVNLGMQVTELNPKEHDKIVSWISHLPHIASACLINSMRNIDRKDLLLSGNGLKDTTRIASGNPDLWTEITIGNRTNLVEGIQKLVGEFNEILEILQSEDREKLKNFMLEAKSLRDLLSDDERRVISN